MNWFSSLMGNLNYGTVFLLMYIEGTVIPVPSELIVSPAAYHAAAGHLDMTLVIIVATLGAVLGSATNYIAAYYLGRPIVYKFANSKWGHMCLLNQEKVEKSEKYFYDHGVIATLTGRLFRNIDWTFVTGHSTNHLRTSWSCKNEVLEIYPLHHHWCRNLELCVSSIGMVFTFYST